MKLIRYLVGFLALLALPALAEDYKPETSVSISGTTARTSIALSVGRKLVRCTAAAYYVHGDSTVEAATTDIPLAANTLWEFDVVAPNKTYMAFITSGATGTCYIYPVI